LALNQDSTFLNELNKSTTSPTKRKELDKESYAMSHKSSYKLETMSDIERLQAQIEYKRLEL